MELNELLILISIPLALMFITLLVVKFGPQDKLAISGVELRFELEGVHIHAKGETMETTRVWVTLPESLHGLGLLTTDTPNENATLGQRAITTDDQVFNATFVIDGKMSPERTAWLNTPYVRDILLRLAEQFPDLKFSGSLLTFVVPYYCDREGLEPTALFVAGVIGELNSSAAAIQSET